MQVIDLAVIIPTLNEQGYIGTLLDSLASQTVLPKEVVIVDAYSQDETQTEVMSKESLFPSLRFYQVPKKTIGRQRNYGVAKTKAPHILFLDADMRCVTETTIEELYSLILSKNPSAATTYVKPYSSAIRDMFLYGVANIIQVIMQWIKPSGTTMNLYVQRSIFVQLHGFDEDIVVGEDFEFLTRLGKAKGRFMVFWGPKFYTSVRRLDYEGRLRFTAKLVRSTIHTKRKGYKNNPMQYEFGHFSQKKEGTMG